MSAAAARIWEAKGYRLSTKSWWLRVAYPAAKFGKLQHA